MNKVVAVFKALSDGNRLRVVAALMDHPELCACQITQLLRVTGATASRHMGVLLSAKLIESRKSGRWVFYRIRAEESAFDPVLNWVKSELFGDTRRQADRILLHEITSSAPEILCRKKRDSSSSDAPLESLNL